MQLAPTLLRQPSKICHLVRLANESAVRSADAFHLQSVRCGDAYANDGIEESSIDDVPLTFCSSVRRVWSRKLEGQLTELAGYADTPLYQKNGQIQEFQIAPRRFRGRELSSRKLIVAAVEIAEESTFGIQNKSTVEKTKVPTQGFGTTCRGQPNHC